MSQTTDEHINWTTSDIELLPETSDHYEIIYGELFVTRVPHWKHQKTCRSVSAELRDWSLETGLGEAVTAPGLIFTDADNVIPDVVWISKARLAVALDEAGHLTIAPELAIEVLSPGLANEQRDREAKLKLYRTYLTSFVGLQGFWHPDLRSITLKTA